MRMIDVYAAEGTFAARQVFWICFVTTAASALTSLFFAVIGVLGDGAGDPYALYALSRSVALAVAVLALGRLRTRPTLIVLALTMSLVQGLDALIGLRLGDVLKTLGPAVLAVATSASAVGLARRSPEPR
jgi:hypothetical protein